MTNSQTSSNGSPNGSKASEVITPAGAGPAGVRAAVRSPAWMRLSQGMAIRAVIEARLLGKRLLTLDADIAILPASAESEADAGDASPRTSLEGPAGRGLVEAARALESGAADLRAARREMP